MYLPAKGTIVPLEEVRKICVYFSLSDLLTKIDQAPPPREFISDGCSMWVNHWNGHDLYPACFKHDLKYWAGYPGEHVARLVADAELMIEVAHIMGSTHLAEIMFAGLRAGGVVWTGAPFSWGFGRITKERDS